MLEQLRYRSIKANKNVIETTSKKKKSKANLLNLYSELRFPF